MTQAERGRHASIMRRYLCKECIPGPLTAAFGRTRPSGMEGHLLHEHGILGKVRFGGDCKKNNSKIPLRGYMG